MSLSVFPHGPNGMAYKESLPTSLIIDHSESGKSDDNEKDARVESDDEFSVLCEPLWCKPPVISLLPLFIKAAAAAAANGLVIGFM